MKVEKSLQTSSTQTARSWLNCLRPAVCDGHKSTQKQKAENQSPVGEKAKGISTVDGNARTQRKKEIELLLLILLRSEK